MTRFAAAIVLLGATAAAAQPVARTDRSQATAEISPVPQQVIELRPGGQSVIKLNRPFSSVTVGDPEIVDVLPRSDRVFVVMGKKVGSADVVVFDNGVDIYRITAAVGTIREPNRVYAHGKKALHQYHAYECTPICVLVEDKLSGPPALAPIIVEGGSASSTINVLTPPAAPAR